MEEKSSVKSKNYGRLLLGLTATLLFTGCSSNNKKVEPTDNNQKKIESSIDDSKFNHKEKHGYEVIKGSNDSGFIVKANEKSNTLAKETSYKAGARVLSIRDYHGCSIVDALNSIGYDSSFQSRSKLAKKYGIKSYKGTAKQNTKLLKKLKKVNFSNKKISSAKVKKDKKTKKDKLISIGKPAPIQIIDPSIDPISTPTPRPTRRPWPVIFPTTKPIQTASPAPTATATATANVTASPTGTKAPTTTGTPTGTKVPTTTGTPTGTKVPTTTGTPVVVETAKPTGTPVVVETAKPTGSPAVVETAKPTGTPAATASATSKPSPAPTANATSKPSPTATAIVTPGPSPAPVETPIVTPGPSQSPITTMEPVETTEPCQHGIYDKIDTTAGDAEYCYHLSYVCKECGETISMDSEANKHYLIEYDNRPYDWYKECNKCYYSVDLPQESLEELIEKSKMMLNPDYFQNYTFSNHFHSCLEKAKKVYVKAKTK